MVGHNAANGRCIMAAPFNLCLIFIFIAWIYGFCSQIALCFCRYLTTCLPQGHPPNLSITLVLVNLQHHKCRSGRFILGRFFPFIIFYGVTFTLHYTHFPSFCQGVYKTPDLTRSGEVFMKAKILLQVF